MSSLTKWTVEKVVHFDFEADFIKNGLAHFGFHVRNGAYCPLDHQKHMMGLVGENGQLKWTAAKNSVFPGVPNVRVALNFPIFVDSFTDGSMLVSNFGDSRLYRIYPDKMQAKLLIDGGALGIKKAGNSVIDADDRIWLNEVEGCRIRQFDQEGSPIRVLGNGEPGFQSKQVEFDEARFNWIYDMRLGPDGKLYVLDSKNFAVRVIDTNADRVFTIAGTGKPGYTGDGGDPLLATFGSDPAARFDGPISLSVDEDSNIYIGDRFNRVVRMINQKVNTIDTIAGNTSLVGDTGNDPNERDPLRLNLPKISSMDYYSRLLYVPTDLAKESGDLAVLARRF